MDIIGYEGLYKISNKGNLKSFYKEEANLKYSISGKRWYYFCESI